MAKIVICALFLCSLSLAFAEMIVCGDKCPEICKNDFAKKFDEEYRKLHANMVKKVFAKNIEAMTELSEKLPKDDFEVRVLKDTTAARSEDLKKIDENMDKPDELAKIMHRLFSDMTMPLLDPKTHDDHVEDIMEIIEKHHPRKAFFDAMKELMKDTAKLYTEMYADLREIDTKKYNEYQSVNNAMKFVHEEDDNEDMTMRTFFEAMVLMAKHFNTPFVDHIEELFKGEDDDD